jgi:tRNA A-37 threonylcarbamoyl transferase component Bud32
VTCPDENVLVQLVEGAIRDRAELDRHFDECATCSELVGELARLAAPARPAPDRYRIIRRLGAGAMGVVWEAEDLPLGRRVALKWIHPDGVADRERRARLHREARALAQLRHPNVVAVYDVGEAGDELYLALELVVGTTARAWRARPELPARTPGEILALWIQVGAGLAAVHRAGIVHRDVKPDNVLVADDGRVLIGDFGLATGDLGDTALELTASGQLLGTPIYMAPEQLRGEAATARSDQFALCVCLWEALTGRRPFAGDSIAALAVAMLTPPALPAGADRAVFVTLARGLQPDPERRWPDVAALLDALATRRPGRRRRAGLGIAAVLVLGGGVATWQVTRATTGSGAPGRPPAPLVTAPADAAPLIVAAPVATAPRVVAAAADAARADAPADTPPAATMPAAAGRPLRVLAPPDAGEPAYVIPAWQLSYNRASDRLRAGDAAACLRELADSPPAPPHVVGDVEALRAQCTMRGGDCTAGRAVFDAALRARGASPDSIATLIDLMDFQHCALDAPPAAKWPGRAWARLQEALASKGPCKPVLDFIDHQQLQLPAPAKEYELVRLACEVRDGDCATARARYHRLVQAGARLDPARLAALEADWDRAFDGGYPKCAR